MSSIIKSMIPFKDTWWSQLLFLVIVLFFPIGLIISALKGDRDALFFIVLYLSLIVYLKIAEYFEK